jgi:hypothetical protein
MAPPSDTNRRGRNVHSRLWPLAIGLSAGASLGVLNLVATARQPFADDESGAMLLWAAAIVLVWSAASSAAAWHTRRFADAVAAGIIAGVATLLVFHAASILRVNLFLDLIRHRTDWQNLVARFNASGYGSLRTYANYEYVRMTPLIIAVGAVAGAVSGVLGGALNIAARGRRELPGL